MKWRYSLSGDIRERVIFTWFPYSHGGYTYWLTKIKVVEIYHSTPFGSYWFPMSVEEIDKE